MKTQVFKSKLGLLKFAEKGSPVAKNTIAEGFYALINEYEMECELPRKEPRTFLVGITEAGGRYTFDDQEHLESVKINFKEIVKVLEII